MITGERQAEEKTETEKSKAEWEESEKPQWAIGQLHKWGQEVKEHEDWERLLDLAGSHQDIWKDDFSSVNGIEANVSGNGRCE